jgi:adenosylmethionine-8-amino-7-oxononanoate aminotransferase
MLCVENVADKESRALLPEEARIGRRITQHCAARGAIVRPIGHLNILSPPLTLTPDQIDELVGIIAESIEATADDLVREGIWKG